jgi:hypothetical protein
MARRAAESAEKKFCIFSVSIACQTLFWIFFIRKKTKTEAFKLRFQISMIIGAKTPHSSDTLEKELHP